MVSEVDLLGNVFYGFSVALQPTNLLFAFLGVFIGTAVGVLPGLGASGAIALLLPVTFGMDPVVAVIMVAGIYYGTMYGGSTTSILLNIPGEAASVVTAMDGYQMAKKGRAGPALGMCAFASFIAGTVGLVLLTFLAPLLSTFALRFGPPENTVLLVLGLILTSVLSMGSRLKGLMMVVTGLIMGAFPAVDGAAPLVAYQAVFGFLAATVLLALLPYLCLPDARPSAGFAQDLRANAPLS